jgi:opacity protein-like surface antigen
VLIMVAASATAYAAEECYTADATGGEVTFRVLQAGAPYTGNFRRFAGDACFAQGRLTRINASLDPSSVDTGLPELDAAGRRQDVDLRLVHARPAAIRHRHRRLDQYEMAGRRSQTGYQRDIDAQEMTTASGDEFD